MSGDLRAYFNKVYTLQGQDKHLEYLSSSSKSFFLRNYSGDNHDTTSNGLKLYAFPPAP